MQVRNEKARRYLSSMRKKLPLHFSQKFPNADPLAVRLLERMLAFDPRDRPTAEEVFCDVLIYCLGDINNLAEMVLYIVVSGEVLYHLNVFSVFLFSGSYREFDVCIVVQALADPYFKGLAKVDREPSAQPITKMEFEFERRRINKDDVRELIYREVCVVILKNVKNVVDV